MASETNVTDLSANHDTEIIAVAVVFQTLMFASFTIRMVSIRLRRHGFGVDDFLLTIALMAASLETIVYAVATHTFGLGHHAKSLTDAQLTGFEKLFYGSGFTQTTALAFAKLSLIWLYYHIFTVCPFRITAWVLAAIVMAWYVASILAGALNCLPVRSLWNPSIPGHCGNQLHIQKAEPIPWILTDFAVLVAPMPMVRKLHMPRGQKVGLACLFLLGGVTCIASCIRYSTVWYSADDVPYDIAAAACWNIVEADLGVIVVSLIVSRPVFSRMVPESLIAKIRSTWSRISSSFPHPTSRTKLFSTFRRMPSAPPVLPSFNDSELRLPAKRKGEESIDMNDMSIRGELEEYHASV